MLVSFVDDSGSHNTSPSYVLSAFYTTPRHWNKIMKEWLGMVHRYGVTAFHATDCANGASQFEGWSKLRRKKMFRNMINILTRHSDLRGCSACIVLKDYEEVVYPEAHQLLGGPKVLAFQLLALEVVRRANQPVAFVVDKPSKGWGAFEDIFAKTKAQAHKRYWANNLHSLIPGDIRKFPAIQTADLLAYESYRELAERTKTVPRRRLRRSMWRLMVEKSLTAPYLEKNSLLRLIEQCKKDGKLKS
jgi:hypothetical protein